MLKEEFLVAYGLSQHRLAKAIGISPNRIAEIVNNRRRVTADTALRLSLYFSNSPEGSSGSIFRPITTSSWRGSADIR
jgi:antitoxin HigA-1